MNETHLYPYSADEARQRDELALWRASHRANIACKEAIEEAVRKHFDGSYLDNDCLDGVLREFGYKRTAWVLSNTIQQMDWDGRFSPRNKAWAKQTYIPQDKRHSLDFVVNSHPAVLDGVVDQYRSAYQALGLFGPAQCEPDSYSSLDYEGKVLVLSPDTLKESYWNTRAQLWYAHDGSGCSPRAVGRSIRCTCLGDGEMTRWNRTDFIGVLSPDYLPNWAREKLTQLGVENIPLNRTELEKSLSRKIESGWDDFTRDILSLSPKEIMERAEDIAAARFCRDEMTENNTKVTRDLYYSGGHLGTLKIPAIGLSVKVYQGTDSATLAKGAGHFEDTSIWDGNVAFAAHNRGVNNHFGKIHTLALEDEITLTTKLGTRTYEVVSVSKVGETDRSGLAATTENRITLYTCVRDQRDYRWCVQAVEVG